MNKVVEIALAWGLALHPNVEQSKHAIERMVVCDNCGWKTIEIKCSVCGCPLKKKIYSPKFNACPLDKWKLIDEKYI